MREGEYMVEINEVIHGVGDESVGYTDPEYGLTGLACSMPVE